MTSIDRRQWFEENAARRGRGLPPLPWPPLPSEVKRSRQERSRQEREASDAKPKAEPKGQPKAEPCWTCHGEPPSSGRECICGGKGTHAEEVVQLRVECDRLGYALDRIKTFCEQYPANECAKEVRRLVYEERR